MFDHVISFIRSIYGQEGFIPLHEPRFKGNEKKYLNECIDSGFVSSVGAFVTALEKKAAEYTGAKYAVAAVNGTAAIHIGLHALGVRKDHEVITQAFTFVATGNAISYTGAESIFVDIDPETLGMCPVSLENFLEEHAEVKDGHCYNKTTGKRIAACVPMHTFGFPCQIDKIVSICEKWSLPVLEDSAESLGSYYQEKHTGTFGKIGAISFNGNKIATAGGGGILITNDEETAKYLKHITTTAKIPHAWEYVHDEVAYNYRMPNINAALLLAQFEQMPQFLKEKRAVAEQYQIFFNNLPIHCYRESKNSRSNYWLNAIEFESAIERDLFLKESNEKGVMTRPPWKPLHLLEMFNKCQKTNLKITEDLAKRIVNIPSSSLP